MTVLPVSVGRTSDLLTTQRLTLQLQQTQSDLQTLYDQLSTGRRLRVASDDAPAATRAILLKRSLQYADQLTRNSTATVRLLDATDGLLSDVASNLIDTRSAATEGAQTVISEDERRTLALSVRESVKQVVVAGNRTFEGHYLLSGAKKIQPFQTRSDYVVSQANNDVLSSFLASNQAAPAASSLSDAFGLQLNQIESTVDLRPRITDDTALADLAGGEGISMGPIEVFDTGGGNWKTVDLSAVRTVGELRDRISDLQIDGRPLQVDIASDRLQLRFADGLVGTLSVRDTVGGSTAEDLGWDNPLGFSTVPLGSRSITPTVNEFTSLADAAYGAGLNLAAGFQIRQGSQSYSVDLSQAQTVGDVIVAINRSGADVQASLDPTDGHLILRSQRSGIDFGIGENGGTVATQLGIRTATAQTKLSDLMYGVGVQTVDGVDFTITRPDGVQLGIDLNGLQTVGDVLNAINTHVANTGPNAITASIATSGNGIVLSGTAASGTLSIAQSEASDAAFALGLIAKGTESASVTASSGTVRLAGTDYNRLAVGGIVDTMMRLANAIEESDFGEISRLQILLDKAGDQLSSVRAEVGLQGQAATLTKTRLEDDAVRLKAGISENIEADVTAVVSQVALRQAAMEASLRLVGQTAQLTVLDFL